MSDTAAELAQRFAAALGDLRDRWDLQYVGALAMPRRAVRDESAAGDEADAGDGDHGAFDDDADAIASAPGRDDGGVDVPVERFAAARPAEPDRREAPREPSPGREPPRAAAPSPDREPARAPASRAPDRPSTPAPERPVTAAQAEAAQARRSALREQAQQWSPATKLEYLRRHNVGDCMRCPLSRTRNHIVFGVGNPQADLMFVGEAPGADEDRQGEPFVGRAGQLLNRWLEALGMRREDVYIANVLKCRPPGNRDPRPEEVDRCSPFLQAQIRAIEPKVIVALGRHAGMLLSRREDMTLRAMRSSGRLFYDAGVRKEDPSARIQIPLVVTYHPAYVLRQEGDGPPPAGRTSPTDMVMTDLRRALTVAGIEGSA